MGLKMKNVNVMGVHQFFRGGGSLKTIYMANCLKGVGLGQFAGGLTKKRACFLGGVEELIPRCTL